MRSNIMQYYFFKDFGSEPLAVHFESSFESLHCQEAKKAEGLRWPVNIAKRINQILENAIKNPVAMPPHLRYNPARYIAAASMVINRTTSVVNSAAHEPTQYCIAPNFRDQKSNHEIHENIVPRKYGAIQYWVGSCAAGLHCLLPC